MKKNHVFGHYPCNVWRKTFRVMKLTVLLMLMGIFSVAAEGFAQGGTISLRMENASLEDILQELKVHSDYTFVYSDQHIEEVKHSAFEVKDANLDVVMGECLKGTDLDYYLENDVVVIYKKDPVIEQSGQQKKKTIKGTVTDDQGIPLPGVSVVIKGTNIGVATDIDGNYTIELESANAVLVFSFVGMTPQEFTYTGEKTINVVLQADSKQMEEVVVTGYQTLERYKTSSSVSTIKAEELEIAGVTSVDAMLQGKLAGVMSMNVTGTPGAAPKIRIRGTATIAGNREPVWVVDGVILDQPVAISAEEINSLDDINLLGNAISGLNPQDIERIDVLKDASATAIYGTKAANGVIVVTTKKGKSGRSTVNYDCNLQFGIRPSYKDFNLMNSQERMDVSKEAYERNLSYGYGLFEGVGYEDAIRKLYNKQVNFSEFSAMVGEMEVRNTDWFDILYRNPFSQTHNLSLSGGNDKTTYYFSGGYQNTQGTEVNVGIKNYNSNMRINTKFNERLRMDVKLSANYSKKRYNHSSLNLFDYAFNTSRVVPVRNSNGDLAYYERTPVRAHTAKYNVLNELAHSQRKIINKGINLTANINYKLMEGLKYDGLVALNTSNTHDEEYADENTHYIAVKRSYDLDDPFTDEEKRRSLVPFGGEYKSSNTDYLGYTFRNQLIYNKIFNFKHDVNVILGNEIRSTTYKGEKFQNYGYYPERGHQFTYINPSDHVDDQYLEFLETAKLNMLSNKVSNFLSWYGAFTYAYDRKYSLNLNVRVDGSNHFGTESNKNLLPIWSLSGKWSIAEEKIFDNVKWLNMLDARASFGFQGNAVEFQTPSMIFSPKPVDPRTGEYYSNLVSWPNDYLKWEKTRSYNIGVDFSLFKNRLSGTFEYYYKKADDLLLKKKISGVNGMNSMPINAGSMSNSGVELALTSVNLKTDNWKWTTSINVYQNKNKVIDSFIDESSVSYNDYLKGSLLNKGGSVDGFYSYQFNGLDENGLPTFKGLVPEEGEEFTQQEYYNNVFSYSGSRMPKVSGGFTNMLSYKNMKLNFSFSFSLGAKKRMTNLYNSLGKAMPRATQNMSGEIVNRWRKPGDENRTNIPSLYDQPLRVGTTTSYDLIVPYTLTNNMWEMYNKSDLRVVSADYLRLRSVTLSYSFTKNTCKKLGLSSLRLNLQGQNLFVIASKKLNGIDPEQIGTIGIPITPNYNFGVNVSF
eukprot:TRINITY_DN759_c0_g1_i1.p1 TRINITY_DN759_c0_g1~~TRINITY_DN759_c0_g1_i1.p1  ORF type:complete len:1199 (-),score=125.62 TRINITY_DN759_c0_g1_i1:1617-5213(-)